jgi:hypothetical protein
MSAITRAVLSLIFGLVSGVVIHYMLYRMGLPLEPFIYVAF